MKKFLFFILIPFIAFGQFPETFDTVIPPTWAVYNGANGLGTVEQWKMQSAGGSVVSAWEVVTAGMTAEDFLVTPQVTIDATTPTLIFDLVQYNAPEYGSVFEVRLSTTSQTDPTSFSTTLLSYTETDIPLSWTPITVDLSSYIGQSVYIAFVHIQNDGDAIGLDNVDFVGGCLSPVISFDDFTATTADISLNEVGDYEIEYGLFPYTQGSGGTTYTITNSDTYAFSGLTPGVAYNVFVRKNCGTEFSDWSEATIGTSPENINTYPYSENLEPDANQALILNLGLSFAGASGTWNFGQDDTSDNDPTNDFAQSPVSFLFSAIFSNADYDAYVFLPPMEMTAGNTYELGFSHRVFSNAATTVPMNLDVVVSQTNDGMGTTVLDSYTAQSNLTYTDRLVSFTPTTTGTYYFGLHNNTPTASTATTNNFNIVDDFMVTETLSVEDIDGNENRITLYPNPVKDQLQIKLGQDYQENNTFIRISDMNGKLVMTSAFSENINVSALQKGIYVVSISDGTHFENLKLIKE